MTQSAAGRTGHLLVRNAIVCSKESSENETLSRKQELKNKTQTASRYRQTVKVKKKWTKICLRTVSCRSLSTFVAPPDTLELGSVHCGKDAWRTDRQLTLAPISLSRGVTGVCSPVAVDEEDARPIDQNCITPLTNADADASATSVNSVLLRLTNPNLATQIMHANLKHCTPCPKKKLENLSQAGYASSAKAATGRQTNRQAHGTGWSLYSSSYRCAYA